MSLYTIIGVMSGTSTDGIDIICARYQFNESDKCRHTIMHHETYEYPTPLKSSLQQASKLSAEDLCLLDKKLGNHFAECINDFITDRFIDRTSIDAIASHGHTVFHQPHNGFTVQIGCGETIAYKTGIKVIDDFRQKDVIAGGQGAPLVPIGDTMLYNEFADGFLNIGGFCNISIPGELTIAFDISPGNLPLNQIAKSLGKEYDTDGLIAKSGTINEKVLSDLNELLYYSNPAPKSLGTEWLEEHFYPILNKIEKPEDKMRTAAEHIATQIANVCNSYQLKTIYMTGGGVFNKFLIHRIKEKVTGKLVIPSSIEIDYKEAVIFGLLGALYLEEKPNTLSSVTGADKDVIGGVLHLP